jgi:hypothetical protein
MTIMCWDGKTLAVDGRVSVGGTVLSDEFNKMFEVNHPQLGPLVCAVTGACDFIGPWLETISEAGFKPVCSVSDGDEEYSMTGLFIDKDGNCWQASSNGGYFHMGKMPTALGSASTIATYLLHKGKSSLAAVQEASEHNLYCGGNIKVYNAKTGKITEHKKGT